MSRSARRKNESVEKVFKEAEQNLISAFAKSSKTTHPGLKGNSRAQSIADFLVKRLPSGYGVRCNGEVVDYLDHRSGETDILIFDKVRNPVFSDDPLWVPAESLLACIEVKSTLNRAELTKSYLAAQKMNLLRPFKRSFTLADSKAETDSMTNSLSTKDRLTDPFRCFRTIFAYHSNLKGGDWIAKEWKRVQEVANNNKCDLALIDRILVLDRGVIYPPKNGGTNDSENSLLLQRWFIDLANFLARENGRRPAVDWQTYTQKGTPGWRSFS
jgi:hypothetical protein